MAVVVKLASRTAPLPARSPRVVPEIPRSAEIVILPCIRRERFAPEHHGEGAAAAHG